MICNNSYMFLIFIFVFIFGASIGSFLNSIIYRLPRRKKIFFDRSICPICQHRLSFLDLIPIFSFLFSGGRCRYCRAKISWQYPIVELTTGFLFLFGYLNLSNQFLTVTPQFPISNFQFPILLLRNWFFISVMVFVFIYDLKYMLIEDIVVIPAIIIIFFLNLLAGISLPSIFLGAIITLGFFLTQYILTKKRGIGEGDLRLGVLIGIMFAWPNVLISLFTSYFIGGIIALALLIIGRKKLTSKIPLGPFLAIGSLLTLFFGKEIIKLLII